MLLKKNTDNLNLLQGGKVDLAHEAGIFNEYSLQNFNKMIQKGTALINKKIRRAKTPFSGIMPQELSKRFHRLDMERPHDSLDHALAELENLYLNDAVYFHHPKYMAHLNTPITNVSILGELIQAAVNTSVDTWDQSAGGTLIEQKLIDWTMEKIGYNVKKGDGVFTSGGTQSNFMALLLARDNYCIEQLDGCNVQMQGLPEEAKRFRIFTSEVSHFSVKKSAALLGLGFDAVVTIPVDDKFCMDETALREAINLRKDNGDIPLAVVATMGTTDFGSIDPITEISKICSKEKIWLHADAAYGCGLLVSEKYGEQLNAISYADSVTVDYHKSFFQPVACSAFFAKNQSHLHCLTYHADYLNPRSEKIAGTPNLVCKSLQTTRRFDALKLWLTLRTVGPKSIGKAFDSVIHLADAVYSTHSQDPDLEFIHRPQLSALVFRFKPNHFDDHTDQEKSTLNRVNTTIRKSLSRSGESLIASTTVNGCVYLKFTFLNPATELSHVAEVVAEIKKYGAENLQEITKVECIGSKPELFNEYC